MARKCPPGVICVQNVLFISMFGILVLLLAFVVYRSTKSQTSMGMNHHNNHHVSHYGGHNGHNNVSSGVFPRPSYSFSNVENDVLMNPYSPPARDDRVITRDIRGSVGIPINVKTQGVDADYRQVGILTRKNGGDEMILPLMGRPLLTNRDKWQFYTMNNNNIKLPVVHKGKSGTDEYGCDNLYNGDTIYVEGLNDAFKVTMYDNAISKYIPFI